jgi:acyl carrier protein
MISVENADVARRIRRVFVRSLELNLDPDDPSFPVDLSSVAGLDSLAMIEFVAGLEEEFHFEIEPDRFNIEFLGNLQALSEYVAERI